MTFVFFSKDRPLQLDAALRSWRLQCQDATRARVFVLYKASNSRLLSLYRCLAREHPSVDFVREYDFRRDLLVLLRDETTIGFAVDDTIFVRGFSLESISAALNRHPDVLGFSLRLGRNTTYCYSHDLPQAAPTFAAQSDGGLKFQWAGAEHDFGYPLELSSSVYRGAQILPLLERLEFRNPNSLEEVLAAEARCFERSHPYLLCAEKSLAFSAPANRVQQICPNRAGENPHYATEALARAFGAGQRISVDAFREFTPAACHQEVEFELVSDAAKVPLISVVIPCYQQAQFLPDAVGSVASQTFADWEIIIVNDGSPDDTSGVARELIKKYPEKRIRLLEKRNGGLAHARNAAIAVAAGAYILPLDADDLIAPEFLARTLAILDSDPGLAIAYTDLSHFGAEEKIIQAAEFDFQKLCANNQLNYCSLFRREAWDQIGGYNANMIWGFEDWDFWMGAGELGLKAQRAPGALLHYRVKTASMYTTAVAHDRELRARIALNHPSLYATETISEAEAIWSNPTLPAPPGAPKVSVIVPTYNRPERLAETLRSITGQTLQDIEIIVINDHGMDIAHVIARCLGGPEIVHLRHSTNRGLAAARNTGLRHARGQYIAYLDDDDVFLPDHLQTLAEFLESSRNGAAYTDAWCAEERLTNGRYEVVKREARFSADWDNERILVQNLVPVLCFMHERRVAIAAGGFDEQMTTHEDWDFWIRLSRLCAPVHIKKVTCEFRTRADGSSMTSARRVDFLRTLQLVYKKYRRLATGKKTVKRAQRDFLHGLKKELRQQNQRPLSRWLRNTFKF